MKIQTVFFTIVLIALVCLQTSIVVKAQDRPIDTSNDLEINDRDDKSRLLIDTKSNSFTTNTNNGSIPLPPSNPNPPADHDNGVGNGTPADPPTLPDGSSIECSKPEFIYCSNEDTHIKWTVVENATSYHILLVLLNSATEAILDHSEILQNTANTYPLYNISRDFNQVSYSSGLQVDDGYGLQIHITPNFSEDCNTSENLTLTGEYAHNIGECVTQPDGSEHFGPNPVEEHNPPGGGEGAKGFAIIETDVDKRGNQNILPNSTLQITPNPVENRATITVDLPSSNNPLSINIYNANGQHIQELTTTNNMNKGIHHFNYETDHLPAGIYYCYVQSGDQIITKKIVKMD